MPKPNTSRIMDAQRQRQQISKKAQNYVPSTIYLQVVGSGARGVPNTLYLFTDQKRYLFNCGESTQRLSHEHKVKLTRLDHIFITNKTWKNIGGLPGLSLTLQDVGVPNITLHGPEGLDELYKATKRFVIMKDMNVTLAPCSPSEDFVDNVMTVKYVLLRSFKPGGMVTPFLRLVVASFPVLFPHSTGEREGRAPQSRIFENVMAEIVVVQKADEKRQGTVLPSFSRTASIIVFPQFCTRPTVQRPTIRTFALPLLEVPDISYLTMDDFSSHYDNGVNPMENIPAVVVHFTPPHVFRHPIYRMFISKFGPTTHHLVLNEDNTCLGSEAVHRTQHRLHVLDADVFPLLRDASIPAMWKSQPPTEGTVGKANCLEELKNRIAFAQFQNIIRMEETNKDSTSECPETKYNFITARTLTMFHLRPKKSLLIKLTFAPLTGLIGVLQARREAFSEQSRVPYEPVQLLAPGQIVTWLLLYDQQFESIREDYALITNQSLLEAKSNSLGTEMTPASLSRIGVQHIRTCLVAHCPNAFGVAIDVDGKHKITYSGDTIPCKELVTIGQNSTLLIHEATMEDELAEEARIKMHSTTSQAIHIGREMNAKYTVLTHFSQRYARLPRLSAHILHDNNSVGVAFDNMQIRMKDLELLPYMYAPLQLMFAEHCVELEVKAAHRARRRERGTGSPPPAGKHTHYSLPGDAPPATDVPTPAAPATTSHDSDKQLDSIDDVTVQTNDQLTKFGTPVRDRSASSMRSVKHRRQYRPASAESSRGAIIQSIESRPRFNCSPRIVDTNITAKKVPSVFTPVNEPNIQEKQTRRRNQIETLKNTFCREAHDIPALTNASPANAKRYKPQLEDIKSSYLLLNKKNVINRNIDVISNDCKNHAIPKPEPLNEIKRRQQLIRAREKYKSKKYWNESKYKCIEGLNWISWK
ncbi:Zinc phosphodiesterase ELAC protein 2 [Papilio machaon]|uniref:ribonuclease Z n=1 Tax=Papilio machaon TaxID=76193 RepID=A0A194QTI0_PAPMA|nr:Zinc phosphodiesterase ELAC protein 2 [Papilio machaon]